jgi:chaperonin GroEL
MKQITLETTREQLKAGVDKLANVVGKTMGGKGKNVVISNMWGVHIINDGVSIAREVELEDDVEHTGAMLARQAAEKTNEEAGDGTTTTIVLLQAYLNAMMKVETKDSRGLREAIKAEIEKVIEIIDKDKRVITEDDIYKVAKNSSLDEDIARVITEVIKKVGKDGVINIEDSSLPEIKSEMVDGIRIEDGYITPYMINNRRNNKAEFKNTAVLITKKKLATIHDLVKLLELMIKDGQSSLVIFCEQIADEVAGFLVANKMQGAFQSVVIKTKNFEDIESITGAKIVSDDSQFKYELSSLGFAGSVIVSKRETIVSASADRKEEIKGKIDELKSQLETCKEDEKKSIKERIAKLENGVATIRIGGQNEQESKEKKLKLEDALNAAKSALEDGIVEGGGMTLLRISKSIQAKTEAERLVANVLEIPFFRIMENSEEDVQEVLSGYVDDKGYNVISRQWENFYESGVIDPAKVLKSALRNAFAMGNQILTAEAGIIAERDNGDIKIA